MAAASSTSARGGALIDGQFRLEQLLGEGGMGTVWAAQDLQLQRQVAVKLLSKALLYSEQARARFELEAQLIARINSPHVVQVFAQGRTEQNLPFLVMELLRGEDLAARIEREGRCSLPAAAPIVAQICRGLARAHQLGLVHRDIKPQNIFLVRDDHADHRDHRDQNEHSDQHYLSDSLQQEVDHAGVLVKLLDFGIAKDLSIQFGNITMHGEVIGSPRYISPEQLRDPQSVDASADIWAVGIVIYEMLTGRTPFDAKSLTELDEQHTAGRFPAASSLVANLPPELDELLCRAIHVDRTQRFQSVEELGEAFACLVRLRGSRTPSKSVRLPARSNSPVTDVQTSMLRDRERANVTQDNVNTNKTRVIPRFALIATSLLLVAALWAVLQARRGESANVRFRSPAKAEPIVVDTRAAISGSIPTQPAVPEVAPAPQLDPPPGAADPHQLDPQLSTEISDAPKLAPKAPGHRHKSERQTREIQPHVAAKAEASEPPVSIKTDTKIDTKTKTKPQRPEPRNHGF